MTEDKAVLEFSMTLLKVSVYAQNLMLNLEKLQGLKDWSESERQQLHDFSKMLTKKLNLEFRNTEAMLRFEKHYETLEYLYNISLMLFKLPKEAEVKITNSIDFTLRKYASPYKQWDASLLRNNMINFHHMHDRLPEELKALSKLKNPVN
jgi:hypothetical protein